MSDTRVPQFPFAPPQGYLWLVDRGLVGFEPLSSLQPWFYVGGTATFDATEKWPQVKAKNRLVVFARRQDNDDLACFEVGPNGVVAVIVIHGWTDKGYTVVAQYRTFWDWLAAVVEDIREWCETVSD